MASDDPDPDRPGFHDLVTPFIFVKHGDPDPVEWKRANPGWVSFPATFVPHKRPIPKWTVLNGKRWPLDKKGMPWPRSVFGQPLCPLNEYPPGVPAPGTQGKQQEEQAAAIQRGVEAFQRGETSVEWFLAEGARYRAERAAREAVNPSPPPAWESISDPLAPVRAYQEHRAREADILRKVSADPDGLGAVRDYRAMMESLDASMRVFAEGARQRNAAWEQPILLAAAPGMADGLNSITPASEPPEVVVTAKTSASSGAVGQVATGFGAGRRTRFATLPRVCGSWPGTLAASQLMAHFARKWLTARPGSPGWASTWRPTLPPTRAGQHGVWPRVRGAPTTSTRPRGSRRGRVARWPSLTPASLAAWQPRAPWRSCLWARSRRDGLRSSGEGPNTSKKQPTRAVHRLSKVIRIIPIVSRRVSSGRGTSPARLTIRSAPATTLRKPLNRGTQLRFTAGRFPARSARGLDNQRPVSIISSTSIELTALISLR